MKKLKLTILLFITGLTLVNAQGIKFIQGLNWTQVLAKAKEEHKDIFLDCYATWCGPCKAMDQQIYPQKQVGDTYNRDFISVRLQMDKTAADGPEVKDWYETAKMIETNYNVGAYPTFLFFDADGNPLNKSVGVKDVQGFLQMATDARDTAKQYYRVLRNFKPGVLDTGEEKGLAYSYCGINDKLAARIVFDYLSRIQTEKLSELSNGRFMVDFHTDPKVLNFIIYHLKGLTKAQLTASLMPSFIAHINDQRVIKDFVADYFSSLSHAEIGQTANLAFMSMFADDARISVLAKNHIATLKQRDLYTRPVISFLAAFAKTPDDRTAFDLFYYSSSKVDAVMSERDYAKGQTRRLISNVEVIPVFNSAIQAHIIPDFDSLKQVIAQKYKKIYAD